MDSDFGRSVGRIEEAIESPRIPGRAFNVLDYGCVSGANAASAFRACLNACAQAGGGTVRVPAGEYVVEPLHLPSRTRLHLEQGATVRFTTDPARFPRVLSRHQGNDLVNFSPLIYAFEAEDLAITGEGVLDGGAWWDNWWWWTSHGEGGKTGVWPPKDGQNVPTLAARGVPPEERVCGEREMIRPSFIQFLHSRRILIEGVTIRRSPKWLIHPVLCEHVTVRGVTCDSRGPNNDGCDAEACRYVLIEDCRFHTGDDCICLKAGRGADADRFGRGCEDYVIRRCTFTNGNAALGIGSEISGGARNIYAYDLHVAGPGVARAFRIKSNLTIGGEIRDVHVRDVRIDRVFSCVASVDFVYAKVQRGDRRPRVGPVRIEGINCRSSPRALLMFGHAEAPIGDISVCRAVFGDLELPDLIEHAPGLCLADVAYLPRAGTGQVVDYLACPKEGLDAHV